MGKAQKQLGDIDSIYCYTICYVHPMSLKSVGFISIITLGPKEAGCTRAE